MTSPARARRRAALLALAGVSATLALAPTGPALAAANPGQAVVNDYGQSDAEVALEIHRSVEASVYVKAALARYTKAHALTVAKRAAESRAKSAYLAAVRSKVRIRITRTHTAYLAAHSATAKAYYAERVARTKLANLRAAQTAKVRAQHYRPKDGVFTGRLVSYLVPTIPFSFEPLQVRIHVYGGHVSDVAVTAQAPTDSDSYSYNEMSLSTLMLETMAAHDTAKIAAVSGASLSSEAFQQSLESALVAAGYKL